MTKKSNKTDTKKHKNRMRNFKCLRTETGVNNPPKNWKRNLGKVTKEPNCKATHTYEHYTVAHYLSF